MIDGGKVKRKKIIIIASASILGLLAIYFGMAAFFMNHFYPGSEINGINISMESVDKAKEKLSAQLLSYKLNLKERGGKSEQVSGSEIGLKYTPDNAVDDFKAKQKPLKWVFAIFDTGYRRASAEISYDESLFDERVDALSCFSSSGVTEPKNPGFQYTDKGYAVVDEVNGNEVNKDILYGHVVNAILKRQDELDLKSIDCYVNPQYTAKSPKVKETLDMLNKYVSAKVTYVFSKAKAVLDGSTINKWLSVDENLNVTIDEAKMVSYLNGLSKSYADTGEIKDFVTSSGKTININGGDYTWMINTAKEAQSLSTIIKEGKTVTKEPAYIQKNAFVEIDLTKQHLWFYKNGSLVVQGSIVSGNTGLGRGTPAGIYKLKSRERNAVLRGPGYAAPVDYWMPFNEGIGIHDASWRSKFGGSIYKYDGSHGCINCPYSLAKKIYENIQVGTPVICYY